MDRNCLQSTLLNTVKHNESLKNTVNSKTAKHNVKTSQGKLGFRNQRHTKHTSEMLIITKGKNIHVSVDHDDGSVCGRKPSGCWNNEVSMAEGETEDLVNGGDLQLLCLVLHVLHTFL
jgi:hypothetical protein